MKPVQDPVQSVQRLKVGLIGLAAVLALIALASVVIGSASRERPLNTIGAPQPGVVANMALDNGEAPATQPLAELGVAPNSNIQAPAGAR